MRKDISMIRGDSLVFDMQIKDVENATVESLFFSVRECYKSPDYVFQLSIGNGIEPYTVQKTVGNETVEETKYRVRVAPDTTEGLTAQSYVYDLQLGMGGDIYTILIGEFTLKADVTREVE